MQFRVAQLAPGLSYMLRVVLVERDNVLAVSVRSFRVGSVNVGPETLPDALLGAGAAAGGSGGAAGGALGAPAGAASAADEPAADERGGDD